MKGKYLLLLLVAIPMIKLSAQDVYKFKLEIPVFDYPENIDLPYKYPSMNEALQWSGSLYELGFWGIDELGDVIFRSGDKPYTGLRKFGNNAFKYVLGLGFSKYGSELPVPLGIWAHEEFHRSALGVPGIHSENGNWIFGRWDGTVYGVSDEALAGLKQDNNNQLLYSYIAGVQYEIHLNEKITLGDFYYKKTFPRAALLLYNAWYVYDYFRFSTSSASDSAKVLAPPHENADPSERDFAGADLTAWVFDMFNPDIPFVARDPFPNGSGVNRRLGFSDLSLSEQNFLKEQKKLSLLNFLNPAIFFIDRIKISDGFSFNFFTQYMPAHFGHDAGLYLPMKFRESGLMLNIHSYKSDSQTGFGAGAGLYNLKLSEDLMADINLRFWNQPESFSGDSMIKGGYAEVGIKYFFTDHFSAVLNVTGKTDGWMAGNPYLEDNFSIRAGLSFSMTDD